MSDNITSDTVELKFLSSGEKYCAVLMYAFVFTIVSLLWFDPYNVLLGLSPYILPLLIWLGADKTGLLHQHARRLFFFLILYGVVYPVGSLIVIVFTLYFFNLGIMNEMIFFHLEHEEHHLIVVLAGVIGYVWETENMLPSFIVTWMTGIIALCAVAIHYLLLCNVFRASQNKPANFPTLSK